MQPGLQWQNHGYSGWGSSGFGCNSSTHTSSNTISNTIHNNSSNSNHIVKIMFYDSSNNRCTASCKKKRLLLPGGALLLWHLRACSWVAVKELNLSYYIGESLLFTIYTHYGNLIYVTILGKAYYLLYILIMVT